MRNSISSFTRFLVVICLTTCVTSTVFAQDNRFQIAIGAGLSDFQMDDINRHYIAAFAEPAGLFSGELSPDLHFRTALECRLSRRWVVLCGYQYLSASLAGFSDFERTHISGGSFGEYDIKTALRVRAYLPTVGGRIILKEKPVEVRGGMDVAYLIGEVDFSLHYFSGVLAEDRTTKGMLFSPVVDISLHPYSEMGIQFSLGYRFQSVGSVKDGTGTIWSTESYGRRQEIGLDFEGGYFTTNLVVGI